MKLMRQFPPWVVKGSPRTGTALSLSLYQAFVVLCRAKQSQCPGCWAITNTGSCSGLLLPWPNMIGFLAICPSIFCTVVPCTSFLFFSYNLCVPRWRGGSDTTHRLLYKPNFLLANKIICCNYFFRTNMQFIHLKIIFQFRGLRVQLVL